MKKVLIKLGQELYWDGKKDNVAVKVVDIDLPGEQVCIMDGGISHIVNAENLSLTSSNVEVIVEKNVESDVIVEHVCTKPQLNFSYDKKTSSVFIVINDKTTICIPGVREQTLEMIGVANKHDDDTYNEKMGRALAFYRSEEGKQKVMMEQERKSPFPFPGFPFGMM